MNSKDACPQCRYLSTHLLEWREDLDVIFQMVMKARRENVFPRCVIEAIFSEYGRKQSAGLQFAADRFGRLIYPRRRETRIAAGEWLLTRLLP